MAMAARLGVALAGSNVSKPACESATAMAGYPG
jgi:hypothetical protein